MDRDTLFKFFRRMATDPNVKIGALPIQGETHAAMTRIAAGNKQVEIRDLPEDHLRTAILCCLPLDAETQLAMPDNKTGVCAWGCGRTIQHRPNVPDEMVKVCIPCALERKDN